MPNLTIKNISDELYQRLKASAQRHHRSLNKEVIACLDLAISGSEPHAEDVHLQRARELVAEYGFPAVPDGVIEAIVRAGRDDH